MNNIKFLLFDFDGVLINSEELYYNVWNELLTDLSFKITRKELIGKSNMDFLRFLGVEDKDNIQEIISKKEEIVGLKFREEVMNFELKDMLFSLAEKNIGMGIVSNNSLKIIEQFLAFNKLLDIFENRIFTLDLYPQLNPKPFPDLYNCALKNLGINKNNILVVEDSQIGIQSCNAAGLSYIEFSYFDIKSSIQNLKNIQYENN